MPSIYDTCVRDTCQENHRSMSIQILIIDILLIKATIESRAGISCDVVSLTVPLQYVNDNGDENI